MYSSAKTRTHTHFRTCKLTYLIRSLLNNRGGLNDFFSGRFVLCVCVLFLFYFLFIFLYFVIAIAQSCVCVCSDCACTGRKAEKGINQGRAARDWPFNLFSPALSPPSPFPSYTPILLDRQEKFQFGPWSAISPCREGLVKKKMIATGQWYFDTGSWREKNCFFLEEI